MISAMYTPISQNEMGENRGSAKGSVTSTSTRASRLGIDELDVTDAAGLARAIVPGVSVVWNAAADTRVDLCESDPSHLAVNDVAVALRDRADSYTSYTGSAAGTKASVKFVMKVEGPKTDETETVKQETQAAETTFWDRVKNLFK